MDKQKREVVGKWSLAFVVFSILVLGQFVIAAHTVREQGDTDAIMNSQPLEDLTFFYNFSINNTDLGDHQANITKVNISLPSGFTAIVNTNYTSALGNFTVDAGGNLIWENDTAYLVNGTGTTSFDWTQYFGFNATVTTPGNYNFSIYTTNITDIVGSNLSVVINDTTAPSAAALVAPGYLVNTKKSATDLSVNISITDNGVADGLIVELYNQTGLVNSTNASLTGTYFYYNFTNLVNDGVYEIRAIDTNDTYQNRANITIGNITIDDTAPTITATENVAQTTQTVVVASLDITSGFSGLSSGSCSSDRPNAVVTDLSLTEGSLACGTTYTYTVTCLDQASNSGSSAATQITTDSCSGGGSSSSSSSSSSSISRNSPDGEVTWTNTIDETATGLEDRGIVRKQLSVEQKVAIKVKGVEHHVGLVSLGEGNAVLEIASEPQQITFSVGETKKFDLDADNIYDLQVTLNSVGADLVDVNMEYIQEAMPAVKKTIDDVGSSGMGWIVWLIVIVVVIGLIVYFVKKRK